MEMVYPIFSQRSYHVGRISGTVHARIMGVKAQLQLAVESVEKFKMFFHGYIGFHGYLNAVGVGNFHCILVHVKYVAALGCAVHSHSLYHDDGYVHLRGRYYTFFYALHSLFSVSACETASYKALPHQSVEVDRL